MTDGMTYSMIFRMIYSLTFGQYEQLKPPSPKSCCPWHRSTSSMRTRPEEIAETWNRMRNRMKSEWNPATVVSLCFCGVLLLLSLLASSSFSVYSVLDFLSFWLFWLQSFLLSWLQSFIFICGFRVCIRFSTLHAMVAGVFVEILPRVRVSFSTNDVGSSAHASKAPKRNPLRIPLCDHPAMPESFASWDDPHLSSFGTGPQDDPPCPCTTSPNLSGEWREWLGWSCLC